MIGLDPFTEPFVEACRVARLRRWPERPGQKALQLERGDFYAWTDGLRTAPVERHVSLIGEARTVVIAADRVWWVPRLDQLIWRLEASLSRRSPSPLGAVRERIARQFAERLSEREQGWDEVALELLVEQEAAGR